MLSLTCDEPHFSSPRLRTNPVRVPRGSFSLVRGSTNDLTVPDVVQWLTSMDAELQPLILNPNQLSLFPPDPTEEAIDRLIRYLMTHKEEIEQLHTLISTSTLPR